MTSLQTLDAPVLRRLKYAGALALGLIALAGVSPAHAEDLYPQIPGGVNLLFTGTETGEWESNPLLLMHDVKPLWGSITTPEITLTSKTPTSLLSGDFLVNENLFNQDSFNSTDLHGKFLINQQMERWGAGAQINTDYDTTRTSELLPIGLGNTLVNSSVRHLGLSFAPQVSYKPTTVDKISIAGTVVDTQYEKPVFSNYASASITPSYTHNFDPMNAGVFTLNAQRYSSTSGPDTTSDSIGPTIGWIGTLTPRLSANANVGIQTTRQYGSGATQVPWTLQYVYSGDIAFKGQQDIADLSTSRTNYPFGNGTQSLLTTVKLTESHALNELFSLNASGSYQSASYQSNSTGSLDYLLTGSGGLVYHATDRLDVAATYQYRRETLNSVNGAAQDHMGTIGLTYHPKAWNF